MGDAETCEMGMALVPLLNYIATHVKYSYQINHSSNTTHGKNVKRIAE
jgi:hypothetical protein